MQLVFVLLITVGGLSAAEYQPSPPEHAVRTLLVEWMDAGRNRAVPAKIYYPEDAKGVRPVIIFSHGLGGSREGYAYLGKHWAGVGFVSVHLQHAGSDEGVWKDVGPFQRLSAMKQAAADLRNAVNRPKDVSFAIDELTRMNGGETVLRGRLDLKRIGVAGHSFGGYTALAIAGQNNARGKVGDARDPRVMAAVQMSGPVPPERVRGQAFEAITIPVFHLTGTKDESPINATTAAERRVPFDNSKGEACFLNFEGGDHAVFSGRKRLSREAARMDTAFHRHICQSTSAFWEAWLNENESAEHWLLAGRFAKDLGKAGTFEVRRKR